MPYVWHGRETGTWGGALPVQVGLQKTNTSLARASYRRTHACNKGFFGWGLFLIDPPVQVDRSVRESATWVTPAPAGRSDQGDVPFPGQRGAAAYRADLPLHRITVGGPPQSPSISRR